MDAGGSEIWTRSTGAAMKISTLNNLDGDVWRMILDNLYIAGEQKREQSASSEDAKETPAQPRDDVSMDTVPAELPASALKD
jgi:hypothetical protein